MTTIKQKQLEQIQEVNKIKIVTYILDDDTTIVEFFEHFLNQEKLFEVSSFTNPDKFREAVDKNVDLVILDINIPGYKYDALETITYLQDKFPGIYIIVISGYLDLDRVLSYWEAGAFFAIEKKDFTWTDKLQKILDKVVPKILHRLNLMTPFI